MHSLCVRRCALSRVCPLTPRRLQACVHMYAWPLSPLAQPWSGDHHERAVHAWVSAARWVLREPVIHSHAASRVSMEPGMPSLHVGQAWPQRGSRGHRIHLFRMFCPLHSHRLHVLLASCTYGHMAAAHGRGCSWWDWCLEDGRMAGLV